MATQAPQSPRATATSPETTAPIRVLIVDDESTLRESCCSVLQHEGYQVQGCGRGDDARDLLQRREFDVLLLDLNMSQVSGMELLRLCQQLYPRTMVIMMTGNPNVESSIEALRAGAWDYLPKPFTADHLKILFGRARHALASTRENGGGSVPEASFDEGNGALLGRSAAFLRTIKLARKVAQTDASVFITGESGSGKEVIAQFIHHHSRRSKKPMVAINCAALPETLLESEMFGHVKGAFTGAVRDKPGLLEIADGSTLFLDELTEMSLPIQAKLLRVLQDGVVRRVGSETVDARVDVRFVSAMNRDPREATEQGILRKDLYYRLGVVPIHVPPLRQRVEDIPLLAEHFLKVYWKRHRERGAPIPTFSQAAMNSLRSRPWRGNVRELQNVMEHAVVLLEPACEIQPDDLPHLDDPMAPTLGATLWNRVWAQRPEVADVDYHTAREQVLAEFECVYIAGLIERAGANMSKAAKLAGVDRTTLYRLMDKHGLERNTSIKTAQR